MSERPVINDGGPAFPQNASSWHSEDCNHPVPTGMSLRDFFAGMAMLGCQWSIPINCEETARMCYLIADAMLSQRADRGAR